MCRSILYVAPDYPVTIALKAIIERNFPEEYARSFVYIIPDCLLRYEHRRQEAEVEKLQSEVGMPLFVLNAVVFPKLEFPMHIFEPRYRLMLRRCLEGQKRFGLLGCRRGPDGRWVPAAVGCILKITDHRVRFI